MDTSGTNRKKILIIGNHKPDEQLVDNMEQHHGASVDTLYRDTIGIRSINPLTRHFSYILLAMQTLRRQKNYDVLIFWQQFIGIYYALFARLVMTYPQHAVILTFIYKRRKSIIGFFHRIIYRLTVNSDAISSLVVHSELELKHYCRIFQHCDKFEFIRVGTRHPLKNLALNGTGDYFFAAGRSNRDYPTLIEAFRSQPYTLKVACLQESLRGMDLPENVEPHFEAYGSKYLELLQHAYAVIIPIDDVHISAGQLVLIEALRLGKVCIVTEGPCLKDYIDPSCMFTVPPHDPAALAKMVDKLYNERGWFEMIARARELYERQYTITQYGERLSKYVFSDPSTLQAQNQETMRYPDHWL